MSAKNVLAGKIRKKVKGLNGQSLIRKKKEETPASKYIIYLPKSLSIVNQLNQ